MSKPHSSFIPRNRLETLFDGAYTVALTLLVTTLGLPIGALTDAQFQAELQAQAPKFVTWLLSASMIIVSWVSTVAMSKFVDKVSPPILRFAIVQILLVTLLPFSTSLIGEHWRHPLSVVIYSLNLWALTAINAWRVAYAQKKPEYRKEEANDEELARLGQSSRIIFYCTTVSLALSYSFPLWNLLAYAVPKLWLAIYRFKQSGELL